MIASALDAARNGDEGAFRELVEPYRRELHAHCYRLLGSLDDADDLLQETLLSAWRGLPGFAGRSSVRTWLYRIATTRCLNAIRDRRRRPVTAPVPPFDPPPPTVRFDVPWLQPYPDDLPGPGDASAPVIAREGIELAFVAALQTLPPRQVATLVLCDVLDFSLAEAAAMLGTSRTAAKGLLQRARAAAPARRTAPEPAVTELAHAFADAFAADDVDRMVSLLTADAWLAMPPATECYVGHSAIAAFLQASATGRGGRYSLRPVRAGGHQAFACRLHGRDAGLLVPIADASGTGISRVYRFLDLRRDGGTRTR
ncbi:MAG: RNA polymerase subunit sigma-70 [Actinobacteria bacterium]|nr:RNA polymerase subunit sigma-70 [Actinomycetota bacterium]